MNCNLKKVNKVDEVDRCEYSTAYSRRYDCGAGEAKNRRVNEREYFSFGVAARLSFAPNYLQSPVKLTQG